MDGISAAAAVAISGAIACISLAQWWTARSKFRLDLFDRRWAIYQATKGLLIEICAHAQMRDEEERKFREGIRGARFLFDAKIEDYLTKDLWKRACTLSAARMELDSTAPNASRSGAAQAKADVLLWANDQFEVIDAMFGEYMYVEEGFIERLWRRHGPKS